MFKSLHSEARLSQQLSSARSGPIDIDCIILNGLWYWLLLRVQIKMWTHFFVLFRTIVDRYLNNTPLVCIPVGLVIRMLYYNITVLWWLFTWKCLQLCVSNHKSDIKFGLHQHYILKQLGLVLIKWCRMNFCSIWNLLNCSITFW